MIYLDTSAATKLVASEAESDALAVFLAERIGTPLVSSALLYPELVRAVSRHHPDLTARAIGLVQRVMTIPLAADIVLNAATVGTPALRTLDALHLSTAMAVGSEIDWLLTYDKRLGEAATSVGLSVEAPN